MFPVEKFVRLSNPIFSFKITEQQGDINWRVGSHAALIATLAKLGYIIDLWLPQFSPPNSTSPHLLPKW
jgi:hypothetical protein